MDQETEQGGLQWNTSGLTSASYCNVASAVATSQAVVLNLGQVQGAGGTQAESRIELLHRVVLNPRTAKRLHELLNRVIAEHDAYGGRAPR